MQERRDRMRSEHDRVGPPAVVETGAVPADRVGASVDVFDVIAFAVAQRSGQPRTGTHAPGRVGRDDVMRAVGVIDRDRAMNPGTEAGRPWPGDSQWEMIPIAFAPPACSCRWMSVAS